MIAPLLFVAALHVPHVFLLKRGDTSVHVRLIEEKEEVRWRVSYRVFNKDTVAEFSFEGAPWMFVESPKLSLVALPQFFSQPVLVIEQFVSASRIVNDVPLFIVFDPSKRALTKLPQLNYCCYTRSKTSATTHCFAAHASPAPLASFLYDRGEGLNEPSMERYYLMRLPSGSKSVVKVSNTQNVRPTVLNGARVRFYDTTDIGPCGGG